MPKGKPAGSNISFHRKKISKKKLLELYFNLVQPRLIEEKMLILLRQGKISKWFSGIGQEAIAVGCTMALDEDEMIFPMHRNLGVFTSRKVPLERLFCQWQGKPDGFTNGRDRSFHFGTKEYQISGMISHLGPQLSLAAGVALAHKLKGQQKISLAFTGEGGTSEGEFHEALNVAAVWELPVIFVIENNGYGLSTPISEQFRCNQLSDKGIGYGMEAHTIDGNNVLEVYDTISRVASRMRKNPKPVLIECMTFRRRGHEDASGTKYVPKKLMDHWARLDPVENYEKWLLSEELITEEEITEFKKSYKDHINASLNRTDELPDLDVSTDNEIADLFATVDEEISIQGGPSKDLRFIDAISEGLDEAMKRHENLVLMGQDIAEYGGVFKITDGFVEKYGKERVRNTPLCESAIVGIGLGLSMRNVKSMIEMQFADFVTCGFNQIVNNLAKIHYRWGQNADCVIRMPSGGSVGAGPFHSQTNEAWFFHTPGLKLVYPSSPEDAKGLLLAAIRDPNPVIYFEHKALYRSLSGEVPSGYFETEIGKAKWIHRGEDCSIITYGLGVIWAEELRKELELDIDILDLRSLAPLDYDAIQETVLKTGKVMILHEDNLTGGIGGEISAYITENLFEYLDAPVMRCGSLDTPIPFARELEDNYLPKERFRDNLQHLLRY